jgi:hypothetical protein|tara:strand:+ start:1049 stop:1654 length:606 start_codon:yes stop_codon:yes gene_type:complete
MFITDTFIIENLQVLEESKSNGTMKIAGVFQRADAPNHNKRIYEKKLLVREMKRLDEAINERRLMGELDHPTHDAVKLGNVSHLVTKLDMRGNEMIGEAEILNTPCGQVAQALIKGGVKLGISSRGMGSLTEKGEYSVVNDDFKLVTFDLVADPSTKGAFPGLVNESTDSKFIDDTVRQTYDKALSEKVFITMLKNKLSKK